MGGRSELRTAGLRYRNARSYAGDAKRKNTLAQYTCPAVSQAAIAPSFA
jgi:hypothetical protein